MNAVVLVIYCLGAPWLAMALCRRFAPLRALGPVLLCYALGMLVANQPFLSLDPSLPKTAEEIGSAAIPLAIPLLLFGADLSGFRAQGRSTLTAFVLAIGSVLGVVFVVHAWMGAEVPNAASVSGMLVGTYTGGTPNMMAIGQALEVPTETFTLLNAADTLAGGVYLLFLMTLAKPLLARVFPAHPNPEDASPQEDAEATPFEWRAGALGLLASVVCLAISAGGALALTGKLGPLPVILGITTLGLAGSFWPALRTLSMNERVGNYLILVFCVSIGTMTDIATLLASGSVVLSFTLSIVTATILVYFVLARIFRVDVDTALIMSVATVFGPPFVPPVVKVLGNRAVLVPGLTMGLVGYAIGTYLGIATATWLL